MPSRLSPKAHEIAYAFLVERDGERCALCDAERKTGSRRLEIDHIDNNPSNWDPVNLQFACRQCNMAKEHERRRRIKSESVCPSPRARANLADTSGMQSVTVRPEVEDPADRIRRRFDQLDLTSEGVLLHANAQREPLFIDYCVKTLQEKGCVEKQELIDAACQVAGCSLSTGRDYIRKLCSEAGPLLCVFAGRGSGEVYVVLKDDGLRPR